MAVLSVRVEVCNSEGLYASIILQTTFIYKSAFTIIYKVKEVFCKIIFNCFNKYSIIM